MAKVGGGSWLGTGLSNRDRSARMVSAGRGGTRNGGEEKCVSMYYKAEILFRNPSCQALKKSTGQRAAPPILILRPPQKWGKIKKRDARFRFMPREISQRRAKSVHVRTALFI